MARFDGLQDLERDILFFYDYLLFLKEIQKEDCWLNYSGVYVNALRFLSYKNIDYGNKPKKFNSKNYIKNYMLLAKKFRLDEFKGNIFSFNEVKIIKNQWRLL
tara:strand:- start:2433 stop:2741 length:309 start_codon:yes stop_codon:yes gene_type:complete